MPHDAGIMLTRIHGYAIDCTVEGEFELTEDRLRDALNRQDQIVLREARLIRLSDGMEMNLPHIVLDQEELFAVDGGPMHKPSNGGSNRSRRLHTVRHRRRARLGPYSVVGSIHERPGVAPLGSMRLSRPFVVFTEAKIAFQRGGTTVVENVAALIVNGRQISWIGDVDGTEEDPAAEHASLLAAINAH